MKLQVRQTPYIICRQCQTDLYQGQPCEERNGCYSVKWKPLAKGTWKAPEYPPKRCPRCDGTMAQVARRA